MTCVCAPGANTGGTGVVAGEVVDGGVLGGAVDAATGTVVATGGDAVERVTLVRDSVAGGAVAGDTVVEAGCVTVTAGVASGGDVVVMGVDGSTGLLTGVVVAVELEQATPVTASRTATRIAARRHEPVGRSVDAVPW